MPMTHIASWWLALSMRSVVGVEEELASACRQILDLVETHGYRFDDIGVVGNDTRLATWVAFGFLCVDQHFHTG